ncbi:MAG: UDP-N-acetylmuramoyl-L-alanyl-D-glutamate--2,6-diaminopimelate ligase [Bdellovibrionales bacterium]|nr:UDP-N-acetylmuramoyl-L-alanyl-D-glutamate--2,6-diaminopimelate ligase [Ramlibacter sp.]
MQRLDTPTAAVNWLRRGVSGALQCDSRKVGTGDGFIAWPGAATDGRQYVNAALAQGAGACLVEHEGAAAYHFNDSRIAAYEKLKADTGPIAALWFDHPSRQLDVLAVTGTNGKTSTAWWLAQALGSAGRLTGIVGTLGIGVPPHIVYNGLTTPDPVLLQQEFRKFVDEGFVACAIEASSVGIAERRLDGTRIRVAIFTNFTQDHLDYHGSMQAYWDAKAELFNWPGLQAAVLNIDDPKGAELARALDAQALQVWTVSCMEPARLQARAIGYGVQGLRFEVAEGNEAHTLETQLIGQYNVANLLGVIGAMRAIGVPLAEAVAACAALTPVPGRMDCIAESGQPLVAVDYAHTPDALDKALQALRPLAQQRGGKLWCVFGCGGDRDTTKRPLMGAVAQTQADAVIITSDNPRGEQPGAIIRQIVAGLSQPAAAQIQPDRALAIREAVAQAAPQDVILVAGKGHEDFQEIAGVKLPFSDKAHARSALARKTSP